MTKWEGMDRRRFPRINYPCLIIVRDQNDKKNVILTHTENIGIGGLCVILKQSLRMFSPVEVELDLLDLSNHIKCQGKVVWNVQRKAQDAKKPSFYDIGIEFENIEQKEYLRLQEVIDRLTKNYEQVEQK